MWTTRCLCRQIWGAAPSEYTSRSPQSPPSEPLSHSDSHLETQSLSLRLTARSRALSLPPSCFEPASSRPEPQRMMVTVRVCGSDNPRMSLIAWRVAGVGGGLRRVCRQRHDSQGAAAADPLSHTVPRAAKLSGLNGGSPRLGGWDCEVGSDACQRQALVARMMACSRELRC